VTETTPVLIEESDPFCLSPDAAARLLDGSPWRRFAVIGDSLAAGTGDPSPGYAPLPWGDRVAGTLRSVHPDLAYLNTGTVGATSARTLADQAAGMVAFGPDLLHVSCGANDLWSPEPDFARIERTVRRVYDLAAGTGAQLTTFTLGKAFHIPALPGFADRVSALNAIIRALAAEHGAVLVDMWGHPINTRPNLLSADRVHFSTSGRAVMAAEVIRGLAAVLGHTSPPR
jgi:lysophospholipase L1-like esterase